MAGRKKRIADNAEGTTVYLTPEEQVVLRVVLARRKKRLDLRCSLNEIMVDGLWKILLEEEGITKQQITTLLSTESAGSKDRFKKIAVFPRKNTPRS